MALMTGTERTLYHCKFIKQCRCWISEENGAIWGFVGPMLLIILVIPLTIYNICIHVIITLIFLQINIFFLIATLYQVYKSRQGNMTAEKSSNVQAAK